MLHHPLPEAIINAKATPAIVGDIENDHVCSFKVASKAVKRGKRVKFNDHVQKYEYEKFDYVECSRHRKKPSNASKEAQAWQQLRDDMQWILQCKLGATRGRAMAALMDSKYEFKDVDE